MIETFIEDQMETHDHSLVKNKLCNLSCGQEIERFNPDYATAICGQKPRQQNWPCSPILSPLSITATLIIRGVMYV